MTASRRPVATLARIVAVVALVAAVAVISPRPGEAQVQFRCGSPQQAAASAIGEKLGDIFGVFGRGARVAGSGAGTFGTENVNDVWQRCAEPYFPDPPAPPDDDGDGSITSSPGPLPAEFLPDPFGDPGATGDPHIRTIDGVGYGFQGAGDFVMVRDPGVEVEVQARFGRPTTASPATVVRGVAIRVGDHVVTMNDGPAAGSFSADELLIDGEPMAFLPGGWHEGDGYLVVRVEDSIIITTDVGYSVSYTERTVLVDVPRDRAGEPVGLLGDGDRDPVDDLKLADGSPIERYDTEVLYGAFLDDWLVVGDESLFETPFDVDAEGPTRPPEIVTLDTLPPDVVAEATRACSAGGLVAGFGLEECVYDVSVTGDESWIQPELGFIHGEGTIDPATLDPVLVSSQTLVIEPGVPVTVIDDLEGIGTAHELVLAGDATAARAVRVGEPCLDVLAPVLSVVVAGRAGSPKPLVCGATVPVPAGEVRLHVIQRFVTGTAYRISVGQVGTIDLGVLSEGDTASTELLAEERAVATLEFGTDKAVFLDADADDCALGSQVTNAAGEVLATRPLCLGFGVVELRGDVPFRLEVTNGSPRPATFDVTATEVARGPAAVGNLGREVTLDIATRGQSPSVELDLTAGQRVFVENVATTRLGDLILTDPSGEVVAQRFAGLDMGLVEITMSGTYALTLVPQGDETGEHRLIVHDVPDDPVVAVELGSEASVTVAVPGQRATMILDAQAGDRLFIDARGEPGIADVVLTSPQGEVVVETLSFAETGPVAVTEAGEHRLNVVPRTTAVGDYRFVVHKVPDDVIVAAEPGDEVTVDITTPGQVATATFDAAAGDDLTIESIENPGLGDVTLIAPSGAVIAEFLSFEDLDPLAAPESGTYRLVLDPRGDVVGTQTWQL